jgi:hypothetical protein
MIQCVSDNNPYDDEPDPIEEAHRFLKQFDEDSYECPTQYARSVIEGLMDLIKEEVGLE